MGPSSDYQDFLEQLNDQEEYDLAVELLDSTTPVEQVERMIQTLRKNRWMSRTEHLKDNATLRETLAKTKNDLLDVSEKQSQIQDEVDQLRKQVSTDAETIAYLKGSKWLIPKREKPAPDVAYQQ